MLRVCTCRMSFNDGNVNETYSTVTLYHKKGDTNQFYYICFILLHPYLHYWHSEITLINTSIDVEGICRNQAFPEKYLN